MNEANMITLSVVIPTYNGEKTIERAIKSIINQTVMVSTEIIVCDDCSTDKTIYIASSMGARIIRNEKHTGGPNAGRNAGIDAARGKYIAFLDQDDWWLPHKLELQLKELKNGAEFVYSPCIKKVE